MTPDRHWLLTWTCYGNWLPGDSRGFVGNVRERDGTHVNHNIPGTPYEASLPLLEAWVHEQMNGPPVALEQREATALIAQYQDTARIRNWSLEAASVMFNHTHLVVGVSGDPDPHRMLELFKSWATRAIKSIRPMPASGKFWTAKGSVRKLSDVRSAVIYVVEKQPNPLAVCWDTRWHSALDEYRACSPGG